MLVGGMAYFVRQRIAGPKGAAKSFGKTMGFLYTAPPPNPKQTHYRCTIIITLTCFQDFRKQDNLRLKLDHLLTITVVSQMQRYCVEYYGHVQGT